MDPMDPDHTEGDTRVPGRMRLAGIDQGEHDALADLFLGDAELAPEPMNEAPDEPHREPVHETTSRADAPLEPARSGTLEGTSALAPSVAPIQAAENDHPRIELVVLGHLPVRASLWVRHYACLSARKRGEVVGLVRAAGGSAAVDVITGTQPAEIEAVSEIADGLEIARGACSRVILRVDETVEPELLERDGVDELTILTGADEAAVVASYRLAKSLIASLNERLDPDAPPSVRLAIMGAPGPAVEEAMRKLERASSAFLERRIEVVDASGRIDATGTVTVCRAELPEGPGALLDDLLGAPVRVETQDAPARLRLTESENAEPRGRVIVEEPVEVVIPETIKEVEPAQVEAELRRMDEPLAALIPGLTAIESRCPGAPSVSLACDELGRLHLLVNDEFGVEHAAAQLLIASAWTRANLSLLIRAEDLVSLPSSDPADDVDPTLHLLAEVPAAARHLLDTPILVYALASAQIQGERVMVATVLNDGD